MTTASVFISHTLELRHLPPERSFVLAAEQAVLRAGAVIADMSYFTGEEGPAQVSREAVRKADVYVAIVGFRYGTPVRDRPCATIEEATEAGKPRFVFLLRDDTIGPGGLLAEPKYADRQEAFCLRVLESGVTTVTVTTPADPIEKADDYGTEWIRKCTRSRSSGHTRATERDAQRGFQIASYGI